MHKFLSNTNPNEIGMMNADQLEPPRTSSGYRGKWLKTTIFPDPRPRTTKALCETLSTIDCR
jgi:hypothetical protein